MRLLYPGLRLLSVALAALAAALMVLEAGGRITDFCGSDAFLDGHHIIATNGLLHPLFLKLAGEVLPL